jgi:hypothetical protein
MDTTQFLAQIWGPVLLAVGLGIHFSSAYYRRLYHDLEKETLALFAFGIFAMSVGILQASMHTLWGSVPQIVVTLLGWGALLKGAAFLIAPKFVDRGGDWAVQSKLLPYVGALVLLLGAYLSWVGYLS